MKSLLAKILIRVVILTPLLFVFLFCCFIWSFEKKYSDKFYPGIVVAGEPAGGKNYEEVLNYFKEKEDFLAKNGLDFNITGKNGLKNIKVPMFFNGFTTDKIVEYFSLDDWRGELLKAYNTGRSGFVWQKAKEQFESYFYGKKFVFSPSIQEESLESYLKSELNGFLSKASSAQFLFNNGKVSILPEVLGEKINMADIANAVEKKLSLFDTSSYDFKIETDVPGSSQKDLEPFSDFAAKLGSLATINFSYNGYNWKVGGKELVSWLAVKEGGIIGIDESKLKDYFNKTISSYIDSPMRNSRFEIKDNKLVEIIQGESGNAIDVSKNAQNIDEKISEIISDKIVINIPVEITKKDPDITKDTISKYDIKELVASAETNFEGGSLDRQHNIEAGVSKLNGILIAPGEEFSAAKAIGDVTEEAGFVKEYVIKEGKTQKEIGGGLCQLATTLFRLALNAGLPITERVNHRYVISYYGAGLDATIYGPHPDLRFVNDTGNYLLLQGKAENNKVIFEFYGKKDGRSVEISKPKLYNRTYPPDTKVILSFDLPPGKTMCTEIPHNGITADVEYDVYYPDGQIQKTNFHSVYQPWQKVCLMGLVRMQ